MSEQETTTKKRRVGVKPAASGVEKSVTAKKYGGKPAPGAAGVDMTTMHKQVLVVWKAWKAEVDEGIAPLILTLWQMGIKTVMSCQENSPGVIWVMFASAEDAKKFLDLTDYTIQWVFDVNAIDLMNDDVVRRQFGLDRFFLLRVSVRFPVADLPRVMERLGATPAEQKKTTPEGGRTQSQEAA